MIFSSTATPTTIREMNLSLVLQLIWDVGSISRAEIIRQTKLSATTVSALANQLIESGFVHEGGQGKSRGGRRPILLHFNYQIKHVMGIDIGASHVTVLVMDLKGQVIAIETRKWNVIDDPQGSLNLIHEMGQWVLDKTGLTPTQFLGMGISIPTPLDGDKLDRLLTYYMPAWEGFVPEEELGDLLPGVPTYLENDANAAAIAEKWWGMGKALDNLAYIKLGVGVGSGLIIDGKVYRGENGSAGEIGHTTIEVNGRRCRCGNHGCMESYVGAPGVIMDVKAGLKKSNRWNTFDKELTVEYIAKASLEGDPVCKNVVQQAGRYLGIAVANMLNLVNPGLVVLGGELTLAGDLLLDMVMKESYRRALPTRSQQVKVVISELGNDAVAMGAATLVIHHAFQPSQLYTTLGI